MKYRLGKTPARPPVGLRFADVFNAEALPTPPVTFGHQSLMADGVWHMLGNDQAGCCVFSGSAHEHMLWTLEGGVPRARFTTHDVLSDYSAVTGYNGTEASDQGTDMQEAAAYRQRTGVIDATGMRHRIDAFASLRVGDITQIARAAYLFGAVGIGVQMPSSGEKQFDARVPWSIVAGDHPVGGHYIPLVGRDDNGNFLFVSWGRIQAATPSWVAQNMDEGMAYFSREMIGENGLSPESYAADALQNSSEKSEMIKPTVAQLNAAITELRSELSAMSGFINYNDMISDAQMLSSMTKVLTAALNVKGIKP